MAEHLRAEAKTQFQMWGPLAAVCLFGYIWVQGQVMIPLAATQVISDLNTTVNLDQAAVNKKALKLSQNFRAGYNPRQSNNSPNERQRRGV